MNFRLIHRGGGIRSLKRKLDRVFSNYIRLRDCGLKGFTGCCTCGRTKRIELMDCGHYISKGHGGASGVRYDERNAHAQCRKCNRFAGEAVKDDYTNFMLAKYGQRHIDDLKIKNKHIYTEKDLIGLMLYYQETLKELRNDNRT